jgi:hypothetical protein
MQIEYDRALAAIKSSHDIQVLELVADRDDAITALQDVELTAQVKMVELEAHLSVQHEHELQELKSRVADLEAQADEQKSQSPHASGTAPGQDQVREVQPIKDTGCSEMGHLGFGVVLDAGDSYRQTVLTGLESALSRYV